MSTDTSTAPSPTPEPKKKPKKRRTWKQRLKITAIVLIVGVILIRFALTFLLPTVVRKVANAYDLDATFDRMSLGLLDGNAHIWNLELRPRSGGDSIVQADYIQGSISTPNLFRGRLVVYRAEVDGVDMLIDREPDGSIPLLDRLLSGPEDAPISVEPEPQPDAAPTTQPVNLQPPLRIDAVRLSHVKTTFRDRSVSPTFQTTIRTSLRLSDVGADGIPAEFELQVQADPLLDALTVSGVLHGTPTTVEAELEVAMRGLHPKPAAVYLLPLGLRPLADDITVEARANLTANTIPDSTDISALLTVSDVSATADSEEWASLKTVSLDAKRVNASLVELGRLLIETGRASARRSADGHLQVAGFELVPAAGADTAPVTPAVEPPATQDAPAAAFRLTLDELRLADLEAVFDDQAVEAEGELVARLDHLTARDIVFDAADTDSVISLDGAAAVPGVVGAINWQGTAAPFTDERRAAIQLRADEIKPDRLRPYLEALGLESQLAAGVFTANIEATNTTDAGRNTTTAALSDIRFTDRDATLLDLASAQITGLSVDPEDGAIHVQGIDVTGPTLNLRLDADGALAALGLRTRPDRGVASPSPMPAAAAEVASAPAAPLAEPAASNPPTLPRLRIDRLAWNQVHLNFEDHHSADTPVILQGRAGIEAANLVFDAAATEAVEPGTFNAWFELPGVAERLAVNGSLQTTGQGVTIESEFSGEGITGSGITSYLTPLGIELTLKDGRVQGKAGATVVTAEDALRVDLNLADFAYSDGSDELAGVGALRVQGVAMKPGNIAVDRVEIATPRGRVQRHADGTLETAGVRLLPPPPSTQPVAPQAVTTGPPAPLQLSPAPIGLVLKQFRLRDGALHVIDSAVEPALDTVLRGSVELDDASLASGEAPARVAITGAIDGIVGSAGITGTVALATDSPSAKLLIKADRIRGDALAGYMPPGLRSTLREGQFTMTLDAALANHADGGLAGHLLVSDLLLQEQADDAALATVGAFAVRIDRLDPAGDILALQEVSSAGVALDVVQHDNGTMDLLGVRLGETSDAPPAAEPAPGETEDAAAVTVVATTQPAVDVAAMVADARRALPLLTVGKLDLKLDRLRVRGLTGEDAAPVDVARVRLHNTGPFELAGENPEQRPPLKLQIDGGIDPLVRQFAIAIEAQPFDTEPELAIDINAAGINGRGLTDIAPELRNVIDGEGLTEGTFVTRLTASINYGRRGPRDLDLARGFTAAFNIKPLEFRGEPDGPVLAGLEEIRGDGISVQPRNGNIAIKSIEVLKPIGRFVRDEQGLHALGFVIPLQEAESAAAPVEEADATTPQPTAAPAAASPPERPASELRLDRFAVTGIDVVFEDRTSDPVTQVPLKTLDLEVRDISNQMLWTGRPVRFDMLCTSDKVPLPPRKGITATETDAESGLEMRELFSQITANGRIGLKQADAGRAILTGWAKTSVSGFELLGVRGLAAAQEIEIGGGVFDDSNDIRFKDNGLIETRNRVVLTNLSLSEPPGGPIQRILQLPAPIDVAIGAITDPDGSITLNLPVTIESGEVDVGKLVAPAIGAVTQVMVTAIASAPIKAVGGVGDLLGLGGRGAKAPQEPVELAFLPGAATLEPAEARRLAALAERMRRDNNLELQLRHEMSPADAANAQIRANPPTQDVHAMTERLRRDRAQLLADRAVLAAQARAQFAAQSDLASGSVASLRAIDRRLTQIDASLDQLGDLLRPGAAAQADRRTRAASLQVANERFDVIQAAIAGAGIPNAAERVRRTNPQFQPDDSLSRGRVMITLVTKKK